MVFEITPEWLEASRQSVENDPTARLAMNACWKTDPLEVCTQRARINEINHVFSHKVEMEGKPVTNQEMSGRCWIFAAMNAMRLPFMKQFQLEEFEFSQTYLFFWDKIERMNYFLNKIVELTRKGEPVEGRLISFLLHDPTCDGGQWDMLVNLIVRYGVIPKKCYAESFSSTNSHRMNSICKSKLREYTSEITEAIANGKDEKAINDLLKRQMSEIYRILVTCLGFPPKTFTWDYYDKTKNYHRVGPISPLQFYEEHVKPVYDVEQKYCIVSDPRPSNPYGATYTVDCLGNMVGGKIIVYNNQPIETLMKMTIDSIKANEAVWFGSEVARRYSGKYGIEDLEVHDYKTVFGVDVTLGMTKAQRLIYGESLMTHAMVFTAVTCDDNGDAEKWRIENSWGEDRGEKGYLVCTSDWFREFVFEVVVDKKHVPEEVMKVYEKEPITLPAWDPLGALARSKASD